MVDTDHSVYIRCFFIYPILQITESGEFFVSVKCYKEWKRDRKGLIIWMLLGGAMIIYMIFGHIISWCSLTDSTEYIWLDRLLFYFMPWFFFKSGMFNKGQSLREVWNHRQNILKPFVVFGLLGLLTYYGRNYDSLSVGTLVKQPLATLLLSGTFCGNYALWFLLTLFLVKCLHAGLAPRIGNRAIVFATLLISISILYFKIILGLKYPEYLYNTVAGLLFYSAGIELKKRQFDSVVLFVAAIFFLAVLALIPSRVDFQHTRVVEGSAFIWPFAACSGIIVVNNLAKILYNEKWLIIRLLSYVGRNSITFYVTHFIVGNIAFIIMNVFGILPSNSWTLFTVYVGVMIVSLPLLDKLLRTEYGMKLIR